MSNTSGRTSTSTTPPWPRWTGSSVALLAALLAGILSQAGCRGCQRDGPASPPPPAPPPPSPAPAAPPPRPQPPPDYDGPASVSSDGYRITTGFADKNREVRRQLVSGEENRAYVSVLSPEGRPLGELERIERGDLHGFLVARDLRLALYARGDGRVEPGADARELVFSPAEGGEHALITVFRVAGGPVRTASTPIVIQGNLPEVLGPGLAGLSRVSGPIEARQRLDSLPPSPIAGRAVSLRLSDLDPQTGAQRGPVRPPFLALYNERLGRGEVVLWPETGDASWTPARAGSFVALVPPDQGANALVFRLDVAPAPAGPGAAR